jgi:ERCC4-type nuclease
MGALATLTLDYGLPVVTSSDTAETARFIAVSARRETKMLEHLSATAQERLRASDHPDLVADAKENDAIVAANKAADGVFEPTMPILDATKGPLSEARQREVHGITRAMLEQVPGIGPALASRILERWPTMAALANATNDEIVQVPGLSVNLAKEIVRILHGSDD